MITSLQCWHAEQILRHVHTMHTQVVIISHLCKERGGCHFYLVVSSRGGFHNPRCGSRGSLGRHCSFRRNGRPILLTRHGGCDTSLGWKRGLCRRPWRRRIAGHDARRRLCDREVVETLERPRGQPLLQPMPVCAECKLAPVEVLLLHGRDVDCALLCAQALFESGTAPHVQVLREGCQLCGRLLYLALEVGAARLLGLELQVERACFGSVVLARTETLLALQGYARLRLREFDAEGAGLLLQAPELCVSYSEAQLAYLFLGRREFCFEHLYPLRVTRNSETVEPLKEGRVERRHLLLQQSRVVVSLLRCLRCGVALLSAASLAGSLPPPS